MIQVELTVTLSREIVHVGGDFLVLGGLLDDERDNNEMNCRRPERFSFREFRLVRRGKAMVSPWLLEVEGEVEAEFVESWRGSDPTNMDMRDMAMVMVERERDE